MFKKHFFALALIVSCAMTSSVFAAPGKHPLIERAEKAVAGFNVDGVAATYGKVTGEMDSMKNVLEKSPESLTADEKKDIADFTADIAKLEAAKAEKVTEVPRGGFVNEALYYTTLPAKWVNDKLICFASNNPRIAAALTTATVLGGTYYLLQEPINNALGLSNDEDFDAEDDVRYN